MWATECPAGRQAVFRPPAVLPVGDRQPSWKCLWVDDDEERLGPGQELFGLAGLGDGTRAPEHNMGEFARLTIRRGEESMELDLARDWRRWPPVNLQVGPVLHIDDAVSSKITALVGRQAPRDFIDIAAALDHGYRRADLMRLAFNRDPGLRVEDFIQAAHRLDQLDLDDFADYDFDAQAVDDLRLHFADWPRHEQDDTEGQAIRAAANADGPAHPNG